MKSRGVVLVEAVQTWRRRRFIYYPSNTVLRSVTDPEERKFVREELVATIIVLRKLPS